MKTQRNIFGDFIGRLDTLNTIQAGVSATRWWKKDHKKGIELVFETPGLSPSAYQVEIQGHGLAVYTVLDAEPEQNQYIVPAFFQKFPLSHRTDTDNIRARIQGKSLHVFLPYKTDLPERYPIPIDQG
ncbi:MAG: Hsp20/alpha crystallin family protein [Bernardetiaceae bacterium]